MTLTDILLQERKHRMLDAVLDYVPLFGYARSAVEQRNGPDTVQFWYQSACIVAYGCLTTLL